MHDSFHPTSYLAEVREEIPSYDELQEAALAATRDLEPRRVLELGVGTGETTRRLLATFPAAQLLGIDQDRAMVAHAARTCRGGRFQVARLQDPLPLGPFDLVISVLAVHHLHALEKASLFERVGAALAPDGRFVLADLIAPDDPRDIVTEVDGVVDVPSRIDEQLAWLREAGLSARLVWRLFDLAVIVASR
jgi:tRNA (cmo5U34)-methyltransferase